MTDRILLTGGTGFVGSFLIPQLVKQGYRIHAIKRHVSRRDVALPEGVDKYYTGDLTDHDWVRSVVEEVRPDICINLAAASLVAYSFERPDEVARIDYLAAANLMEATRKISTLKLFMQASTSETYGAQTVFPTKETASPKPLFPYAIAKVAADQYAYYLGLAYKFPYILIRNFNTFGEAHSTRRVTERAIAQMLKNPTKIELGLPNPVRDFLFIDDSTDAYVRLIENYRDCLGEDFNVCTGVGISISGWIRKIASLLSWKGSVSWNATYVRPTDIPVLIGCNDKIHGYAGWEPKTSHEDGLRVTIERVKQFLASPQAYQGKE